VNTKRKKKIWGVGTFIGVIIIFISVMTWYYPLSPFSVHQSFTYHPGWETHNGKTYKEELIAFKDSYEEDLKKDLKGDEYDPTIDRTQYILPIFEQEWLIGTDAKTMDTDKLNNMLFDVEQARDTLLDLVVEGDYNEKEKGNLINNINNFLKLEESIRQIRDGKYYSRSDLQTLLGNLRGDFRSGFDFYTTTFYDRSQK